MKEKSGTAIAHANLEAPDPVESLFIGIQFRNGGKQEAIRRVRSLVHESRHTGFIEGHKEASALLAQANRRIEEEQVKNERMRNAIRSLQDDHGNHIIEAINRPVYTDQTAAGQTR